MPGRRPGRARLHPGGGEDAAELGVVERGAVEVPAAAGGVGIERDRAGRERAEMQPRHVGDAEAHRLQRVELLSVSPASLQRAMAASTKKSSSAWREHAVVDDDGVRGARRVDRVSAGASSSPASSRVGDGVAGRAVSSAATVEPRRHTRFARRPFASTAPRRLLDQLAATAVAVLSAGCRRCASPLMRRRRHLASGPSCPDCATASLDRR